MGPHLSDRPLGPAVPLEVATARGQGQVGREDQGQCLEHKRIAGAPEIDGLPTAPSHPLLRAEAVALAELGLEARALLGPAGAERPHVGIGRVASAPPAEPGVGRVEDNVRGQVLQDHAIARQSTRSVLRNNIKIELKGIDVACFERPFVAWYTKPRCRLILESKGYAYGLSYASGQAFEFRASAGSLWPTGAMPSLTWRKSERRTPGHGMTSTSTWCLGWKDV